MTQKTIDEMAQEYVSLIASEKGASPETKSYRYISMINDKLGSRTAQAVSDRAMQLILDGEA